MSASNITPVAPDEVTPLDPPPQEASSEDPAPPDRVTALEQEVSSLKDQLLRHRADFANYKRRVEREHRAAGEAEVAALLSDLLPSFDALEKALTARGTAEEIRNGVEITLKDVATTLSNRGVRFEDPTGEKFDPLRHQALSYEPVPGAPDGTITTCYRKGYMMGDRLIRPALVKVAKQNTDEDPPVLAPVSHQET
jgi:molecular chaperone GrpE